MKRKLTRNIGLKILSLLVAYLIWLLVISIDDPIISEVIRDVPVQILNVDSVTAIDRTVSVLEGDTVSIRVKERRSVVENLTRDDFTVVADLENLNAMDAVPLYATCTNTSVTWDEIDIYPSSMKVQIELNKQSEFNITVRTEGSPENPYEVGTTEVVEGSTVLIAGPESVVDIIGQVVAEVNVNGMSEDGRKTASLTVYDKNGTAFTETQMGRLQIKDSSGVLLDGNEVNVKITLWETMADIPVEVELEGTPAEGYQVSSVSTVPVTVNLVGTQEALARLNGKIVLKDPISVEGASESITVTANLEETLESLEEDLRMPEESDPTVTITVLIEKTADRTFTIPLSNIEILKRPENMTLTVSPSDMISVSVHSTDNTTVDITESDIQATADFSPCAEPGNYEIPVEITLPEGYELTSEVMLVVTSAAQETTAESAAAASEG